MTSPSLPVPVVGALYRPDGRPSGGRGPRLLLSLPPDCPACREWWTVREAELREAVAAWGGRVDVREAPPADGGASGGWLAVLDEWDEVFQVARVGLDQPAPAPETYAPRGRSVEKS